MSRIWAITCLCLVATVIGCGSDVNYPDRIEITGKVVRNNQPVANATVRFWNLATEGGHDAFGTTNDAGEFKLSTFGTDDGAVPGDYTVTVVKVENDGGAAIDESNEDTDALVSEDMIAQAKAADESMGDDEPVEDKNTLPKIYSSKIDSPLQFKIGPDEEKNLTIDLNE